MIDSIKTFSRQHSITILLALFGLTGAALIWINTPWGIGVGYDSIFYLSAADNLLAGLGLSRLDGYGNVIPLTHFPPLYSLSVGGLSFLTGLGTDLVARIFAAILFGALVGLIGWLIFQYTRSLLACVLGATLALVSPVLLDLSFLAMSELLFLVLLLLMIHILNRYLINEKILYLVIAAGLAALLYLTRYVGISAVALGGIGLLIFGQRSMVKRIKDVILFAVISLLPMLVYYVRNWFLTGSMTNRVILFHPPTEAQIRQGISTMSAWLIPTRINIYIRSIVMIIFGIAILVLIVLNFQQIRGKTDTQPEDTETMQFVALLLIYAVIYIIMVGLSLTFFDASTRLNDRILSPLYVIGIVVVLVVIWNSSLLQQNSWGKVGITIICVAFIALNFLRGMDVTNNMRIEGKGFSGRQWRSSETIANLTQLPAEKLIFTNEAFAIYYLVDRPANWIPENYDPVKGQQAEDYEQRINAMQEEIIDRDGALVIFNSISKTNVYAPIEQLTSRLALLAMGDDGSIYVKP